jgi:hypothetical protein
MVMPWYTHKSHVRKNSKVAMSRLLEGVKLVLILLNLGFEIDRS